MKDTSLVCQPSKKGEVTTLMSPGVEVCAKYHLGGITNSKSGAAGQEAQALFMSSQAFGDFKCA